MPKISKHGTLKAADVDGAVAVSLTNVMGSLRTPSTAHLFGGAGDLPPIEQQRSERHYTEVWRIIDPIDQSKEYVGLNKVTNESKGSFKCSLSPGEYKFTCSLPKDLNSNLLVNGLLGTVVGGTEGLVRGGSEGEVARGRKMPNLFCDVNVRVQTKRYALFEVKGTLDQGTMATYTKVFSVTESQCPASFEIQLFSHSLIKRLKVVGSLFRRDFMAKEVKSTDSLLDARMKVQQGLAKKPAPVRHNRAFADDPEKLREVIESFYKVYAPKKLAQIDVVMKHFEGRPRDLIRTLEVKYSVKFDGQGVAKPKSAGR